MKFKNLIFGILGILILFNGVNAQPKITADNLEFTSGDEAIIKITLENIGDYEGTFTISFPSCPPFEQASSAISNTYTLKAGEVKEVGLKISSGAVNQEIERSCVVKVYDANYPKYSDNITITIHMRKLEREDIPATEHYGDKTSQTEKFPLETVIILLLIVIILLLLWKRRKK